MDVGIIIPVYCESKGILGLIERIEAVMARFDYEIVVVDDASPDGTAKVVFDAAKLKPHLRLVYRNSDRGLSKSVVQGFFTTKGDILCVIDGDGQHDPNALPLLIEDINAGADIAIGCRDLQKVAEESSMSSGRVLLSTLANRTVSWVLGRSYKDPMSGLFAIRRSSWMQVERRIGDAGFKILFDILSHKMPFKISERICKFGARESGDSKLDFYVLWRFLVYFVSRAFGGKIPPAFISFVAVGSTGLAVHFIVLYMTYSLMDFPGAQFISASVAVVSNFYLNNILTFRNKRLRGINLIGGFAKYYAIALAGIFANVAVATLSREYTGGGVVLAAFAGIFVDTVWKYAVSSKLVW